MWKFRALVAGIVVVGTLVFGSLVAHGSWWWNTAIEAEGVGEFRVVQTVLDGSLGAESYRSRVLVRLPKDTDAELVDVAPNETVLVKENRRLECLEDAVQVTVMAKVDVKGRRNVDGAGTTWQLELIDDDGNVVADGTGPVGRIIRLGYDRNDPLYIPAASEPDCFES